MPLRFALVSLLFLLASPVSAQTGTCDPGTAVGILETSTLRAALLNTGGLFWRPGPVSASVPAYLVPKDRQRSPVGTASLWVSGWVGGDLRMTGSTFRAREFWPGPLADADAPPADCSAHDRIWAVSRADVAAYLRTGEATVDLAEWPHALGAPVLDGDGIPDNYDLAAGDQPDLLGDVAVWWVMNDAGGEHLHSELPPLGIEVRVQAFAFDPAFPNALSTDTFYRYEIVNRRAEPIDSLRVSLWADAELGDAFDDLVGVDTLRHLSYVYNGNADDAASRGGYGAAPPAWGVQVLSGFVGLPNGRDDDFDGAVDEADEEMRMTSAPMPWKVWDPYPWQELYALQRGLLANGLPMHDYGSGLRYTEADDPGEPTVFAFTGFPGEFWSELNVDGAGTQNAARDSRLMVTVGPGRLAPGASVMVDLAMPFAQGADHLDSVRQLIDHADALLRTFGDGVFDSRRVTPEEAGVVPPPPPSTLGVRPVRPNPAAGGQSAVLELPEPLHVDADVLDVLGRVVAVVAGGTLPAGETALAVPDGLPPGLYLLRVSAAQGRPVALRFTVVAH